MTAFLKLLRFLAASAFTLAVVGMLAAAGAYFYVAPQLPSIEALKDVQLQVPLRVYSSDGALIAEFGEKKRTPLRYAEMPPRVIQAVLAAEDDRFFEHPGVDYQGLGRAFVHLIRTGEKGQGGSTITMQVARNFFLSSEKTYIRKLKEIFLALKIERELTKEEILELYLNKIYLGNRAYGVAAAAQVYYGKDLKDLELAQVAMIAGLPKAPSLYNPIVNPVRAVQRRNYVIHRMETLGFVDPVEAEQARTTPASARLHAQPAELEAPYLAEMVRAEMMERFGPDAAYTSGLKVFTTVESRLQAAANRALRSALLEYDRRHGYRGPEARVDLQGGQNEWAGKLNAYQTVGGLRPALVVEVKERSALVYMGEPDLVEIGWPGLSWARPYMDDSRVGDAPTTAAEVVKPGDVVRVATNENGEWYLSQVPQVAGALISLRPRDGALMAVVGGFDFYASKFNRVIQAQRQPGSNFKPFVYSASLERGFTPASIINDAPVVFEDAELETAWRPENYSGRFYGPTRLREALVRSRNLVSIRLLRSVGIGYAIKHVSRFGFDPRRLPHDLSLALGSASVTPLELARGYAVFANGGYLIEPYFVSRIEGSDGQVLWQANPALACPECEESLPLTPGAPAPVQAALPAADTASETVAPVALPRLAPRNINARNVYVMDTMMQDVVKRGTGRRALNLGRSDLAGKTGTTNDQRDAWFSGFNHAAVTTAWVGFDTPRPLGAGETGAGAALPMWIDFMAEALKGVPEQPLVQPPGLVTVRIDPETGAQAAADATDAIFEVFYEENVPTAASGSTASGSPVGVDENTSVTEQLF